MDLAADFAAISPSDVTQAQAEVVLVGCGAPNRGMGWYHAVQMLEGRWVRKEVETDGLFRVSYSFSMGYVPTLIKWLFDDFSSVELLFLWC